MKKNNKHSFKALLALALAALIASTAMLAGCGNDGESSEGSAEKDTSIVTAIIP